MTVKQEAYSLIDSMSDESVSIIVQIMRLLPQRKAETSRQPRSESMEAFARMEERRGRMRDIDISEAQRQMALDEKYGLFVQNGDKS